MAALVSFGIYLGIVFLLAGLANRKQNTVEAGGFMKEYFLGNRQIGLWAFALTYAATAASGGSFMGFPALIYTHGWSLAWWIAGYMVTPVVALSLFAKRINQVGRISNAITVPELMRNRFASGRVGQIATLLIVFFMFFFLVAQFKAGAKIMATLLDGVAVFEQSANWMTGVVSEIPWVNQSEGDYLLCLIFFAVSVILYTTFGGFRAVVWTDVMQGLVMVVGVIILLVLTLQLTGGLGNATKTLAEMTPPENGKAILYLDNPSPSGSTVRKGSWVNSKSETMRLKESAIFQPGKTETAEPIEVLILTTNSEIVSIQNQLETNVRARVIEITPYAYGAGQKGVYLTAPGPDPKKLQGFLPVMLALSFFVFWNFSGAGQPSYMVRQMAYKNTTVLRRSIIMVAVYFTLIYFPLVLIFTSARTIMPGMEIDPDRIMPDMAATVTAAAGVPWLAGLLVAAPFAAVMSSVDSFLLLFSSSIVRDIYQQHINPNASEKRLKTMTYTVNIVVGFLAVIAAINPPDFLQTLIVFASAGLGACFLVPIVFSLYWRKMTDMAAITGMISGGVVILVLYSIGRVVHEEFSEYLLLGLHPFIWAVVVSAIVVITVSLNGKEPDRDLQRKYFG